MIRHNCNRKSTLRMFDQVLRKTAVTPEVCGEGSDSEDGHDDESRRGDEHAAADMLVGLFQLATAASSIELR